MIVEAIKDLVRYRDLEPETVRTVAADIMDGRVEDVQKAAFLTALAMKGETPEEIASLATVMREHCVRIAPDVDGPLVDTCGTGGDSTGTFNISTVAAFIAAGAGMPVAKHGNRSVSSKCGSADILEALGVKVDLEPERVKDIIERVGIGFMFAPRFHPAMRHVQGVRRSLGIRTVFNVLGPLTNPAGAEAQVIGVYSPETAKKVGAALKILGSRKAMVVHGSGLDELTTTGPNIIVRLDGGVISEKAFECGDLDLPTAKSSDLVAHDLDRSKAMFLEVLDGEPGPRLDVALLNAAAAITVGGRSSSMQEGLEVARESVLSGRAMDKLERLIAEASRDEA